MSNINAVIILQPGEVVEADDWLAWKAADVDTISITFRVDPFWESMDIEELNDKVDQYVYPMAVVDLNYNINVERTTEAWSKGEDGDSIWITCTCGIDWSDYNPE